MLNPSIKKYTNHLVVETCLQFNKKINYQNKKINKYVYGLRMDIMILSIYDMRSMIIKIYPLIHNLFYSHSLTYQPISHRSEQVIIKQKNITPIQILFISSTKKISTIIEDAATFCHMPYYTQRWVNGLLTKPLNTIEDESQTLYLNNLKRFQYINIKNKFFYTRYHYKFLNNKYFNIWHPAMLILPDPSNNPIVWKEAKLMNIPIISLGSTASLLNSNYTIFGSETSNIAVSFFCTLLSWMIKKENIIFNYRTEILAMFRLKEKNIKPARPHQKNLPYAESNSFFNLTDYKILKDIEVQKYQISTKLLWRLYWARFICGQNKTKLWRLQSLVDRRNREFNYFYKYFQKLQNNLLNKIEKKIKYHHKKINIMQLKKISMRWKKFADKHLYSKNKYHALYQRRKLIKWFAQLQFTLLINKRSSPTISMLKLAIVKNIKHTYNFAYIPTAKNIIKKAIEVKRFLTVKDIAWGLAHTRRTKFIDLYNQFVKYKFLYWGDKPFYYKKAFFWHARLNLKLMQYKHRDHRRIKRSFWRIFIRNLKKQFMREDTLNHIQSNKKRLVNRLNTLSCNLNNFYTYFDYKNKA